MNSFHRVLCGIMGWACALACAAGVSTAEERGLRPGGRGKLPQEQRALLAGDSLMESLGPQMRAELSGYSNLTFIPIGKKSTGLARTDFYNWPRVLEEHLRSDRPHVVVMWVGTNDPQAIYGMPGAGEVGSRTWMAAYQGKIAEVARLTRSYGARFILMGPPVVSDARTDAQLAAISRLMQRVCQRADVPFIDTRAALADAKGRFCAEGRMADGRLTPIRTADGVHITAAGNRIVMKHLLPVLSRMVMGYATAAAPARGGSGISGKGTMHGVTVRSGQDRSYRGSVIKRTRRR